MPAGNVCHSGRGVGAGRLGVNGTCAQCWAVGQQTFKLVCYLLGVCAGARVLFFYL